MKLKSNKNLWLFGIFALIFVSGTFIINTNAQTTRRTSSTKTTVKPKATPTPGEVPEIVSRADEISNGNQIILQEIPETQTENPTEEPETIDNRIEDLTNRINSLESTKDNKYDQKQKRLLLNLDILSRAEQRADSLRKQLYELIEKESQIKLKLDQIESDLRPEIIDRSASLAGSLRPEEIRAQRKKSLETEKANLENLLTEISNNKTNLQTNVQKADTLVDKLRFKLEKDIDDALMEEDDN